uniref:Uncharacterized protein n=1 Tax=Trichuris muris TaxID=70415 RepID=A0A5S6QBV4_TRIMR
MTYAAGFSKDENMRPTGRHPPSSAHSLRGVAPCDAALLQLLVMRIAYLNLGRPASVEMQCQARSASANYRAVPFSRKGLFHCEGDDYLLHARKHSLYFGNLKTRATELQEWQRCG